MAEIGHAEAFARRDVPAPEVIAVYIFGLLNRRGKAVPILQEPFNSREPTMTALHGAVVLIPMHSDYRC